MLKDALAFIVDLADGRQTFKEFKEPGGRHVRLRSPDGTVDRLEVPNPRNYKSTDIHSFVRVIETVDVVDKSPIVFVRFCNDGVVATCYFSETERLDAIDLRINFSPQLLAFETLHKPQLQRNVVKLLRDELYASIEPGLLPSLRSIDFQRRNDGSQTITHGRESLGKSVEKVVQSKNGDIPEKTQFAIPFFSARDFRDFEAKIPVAVDLDATNETICFAPEGDTMQLAYESALRYATDTINDALEHIDNCRVVMASPS